MLIQHVQWQQLDYTMFAYYLLCVRTSHSYYQSRNNCRVTLPYPYFTFDYVYLLSDSSTFLFSWVYFPFGFVKKSKDVFHSIYFQFAICILFIRLLFFNRIPLFHSYTFYHSLPFNSYIFYSFMYFSFVYFSSFVYLFSFVYFFHMYTFFFRILFIHIPFIGIIFFIVYF